MNRTDLQYHHIFLRSWMNRRDCSNISATVRACHLRLTFNSYLFFLHRFLFTFSHARSKLAHTKMSTSKGWHGNKAAHMMISDSWGDFLTFGLQPIVKTSRRRRRVMNYARNDRMFVFYAFVFIFVKCIVPTHVCVHKRNVKSWTWFTESKRWYRMMMLSLYAQW